jgi:ribosome recycling factor
VVTEERRKALVKIVGHETEEGRVALRNIRRDAKDDLKELLKKKEISEDDSKHGEELIQKLTDKYIKTADELLATKEDELMKV